MLKLESHVSKGIMFIRLSGSLDEESFNKFSDEINYLLYNQGIHYFVFNFQEIEYVDENIFMNLQNKLIEIFLSCGKVVICSDDELEKEIGNTKDNLFYVRKEYDAYNFLNL